MREYKGAFIEALILFDTPGQGRIGRGDRSPLEPERFFDGEIGPCASGSAFFDGEGGPRERFFDGEIGPRSNRSAFSTGRSVPAQAGALF